MLTEAIVTNRISCLDLQRQHQQLKAEMFEAFEKVYDATAFSDGAFVREFENEFALFCNTQYAVGVNNGTSALHLALLALGIGAGDEVIVPANTFIATAWAVSYAGATPVFVDCTPDTWQIDATKIEAKITNKTKAVIGVHLYGQPFDVTAVKAVCNKHQLYLLEDAAQAQGAQYNGKPVGGFGEMACFSFYPGKNLGACGEAGGITTNNDWYNQHLKSLRNHGSVNRYYHDELGFNMRMGGLEGASLLVKLKHLNGWNQKRKTIAIEFSGNGVEEKGYVTACEIEDYALEIGKQVVAVDAAYFRPTEVEQLIGDATKAKIKLGWQPEHDLPALVREMVASDLKVFETKTALSFESLFG